MRQFERWVLNSDAHRAANCLGLVFICQNVEQGWILDKNGNEAFTIEELASRLNGVETLTGKPKFIIIQQSGESKFAIHKVKQNSKYKTDNSCHLTFFHPKLF